MANNVRELRPKAGDTEKITINLGYVDLGHVDLMVQEGFYSNRTDFIRTAIRNQLERHADVVKQSVARKSLDLGLRHYSREDLEAARAAGQMLAHPRAGPRQHRPRCHARARPRRRSPRSSCWERSTPAPRSRPPSPTACGDPTACVPDAIGRLGRSTIASQSGNGCGLRARMLDLFPSTESFGHER